MNEENKLGQAWAFGKRLNFSKPGILCHYWVTCAQSLVLSSSSSKITSHLGMHRFSLASAPFSHGAQSWSTCPTRRITMWLHAPSWKLSHWLREFGLVYCQSTSVSASSACASCGTLKPVLEDSIHHCTQCSQFKQVMHFSTLGHQSSWWMYSTRQLSCMASCSSLSR